MYCYQVVVISVVHSVYVHNDIMSDFYLQACCYFLVETQYLLRYLSLQHCDFIFCAIQILLLTYLLFLAVTVKRLKTPLHVAADKSHFDLMDTLLKHGAKVVWHTLSILLQFLFIAAFICVLFECRCLEWRFGVLIIALVTPAKLLYVEPSYY